MEEIFVNEQGSENRGNPYRKICRYRFCPKKEFTAERLNQEYCCYDHKVKENNLKAKTIRDKTKSMDYYLKNNRKILDEKYNKGELKVKLDKLESQGFILDYHTETKKETKLKVIVPFYYEYGLVRYGEESSNNFMICKK